MTDERNKRAPDPWEIFPRTGTPEDMAALDRNIEQIADQLIAVLDHVKSQPAATQADGLKAEDVRFLAYALITYRSRRDGVLTEHHLRLLAAALAIQRQSLAATAFVGMPAIDKLDEFLAATALQANEPKISETKLAKAVGVDRKTIRGWRKLPEFDRRVHTIRFLAGERTARDNEVAASWAKATGTSGE